LLSHMERQEKKRQMVGAKKQETSEGAALKDTP